MGAFLGRLAIAAALLCIAFSRLDAPKAEDQHNLVGALVRYLEAHR